MITATGVCTLQCADRSSTMYGSIPEEKCTACTVQSSSSLPSMYFTMNMISTIVVVVVIAVAVDASIVSNLQSTV